MANSLEVTQPPIHIPSGPKAPTWSRILRRRHSKQLLLSPTDLVLMSPTSLISATTCSSSDSLYSGAPPALKRAEPVGRKREPRLVPSLSDQASCRTSTLPSGLIAQRACLPAGPPLGPSSALPPECSGELPEEQSAGRGRPLLISRQQLQPLPNRPLSGAGAAVDYAARIQ
jgi:hypothetical protein